MQSITQIFYIFLFAISILMMIGFLSKWNKRSRLAIPPNRTGLLFVDGEFVKKLEAGDHRFWHLSKPVYLAQFSTIPVTTIIPGQELLTKDNIDLRGSWLVEWQIVQPEKTIPLLSFTNTTGNYTHDSQIETKLWQEIQIATRDKMAQTLSENINQNRNLLDLTESEIKKLTQKFPGVKFISVRVKDIAFPKHIQKLFAQILETKIRAQADMENARTAVASTRALKNAASAINNNPGLKYLMYLETIERLSKNDKNTFVIGENTPLNQH